MILFGNMFVLSFQNFWYKFVGAEWSTEKKVCNHRALPSFLRECKTNLCLAITSKTSENAFKRDLPLFISCVPWGVRGSTFKRLFLNEQMRSVAVESRLSSATKATNKGQRRHIRRDLLQNIYLTRHSKEIYACNQEPRMQKMRWGGARDPKGKRTRINGRHLVYLFRAYFCPTESANQWTFDICRAK